MKTGSIVWCLLNSIKLIAVEILNDICTDILSCHYLPSIEPINASGVEINPEVCVLHTGLEENYFLSPWEMWPGNICD